MPTIQTMRTINSTSTGGQIFFTATELVRLNTLVVRAGGWPVVFRPLQAVLGSVDLSGFADSVYFPGRPARPMMCCLALPSVPTASVVQRCRLSAAR